MVPPRLVLRDWLEGILAKGPLRRKVIGLVSLILIVEGLFAIALFSYVGIGVGIISIVIGMILLSLIRTEVLVQSSEYKPPGFRMVEYFVRLLGGDYALIILGFSLVSLVFIFNGFISPRPEIGDVDTLTIAFGLMLLVYPLLSKRYDFEANFAIIFIALVMVILVLPQAIMSLSENQGTSSIGNWYVHYMLAAPFAGILDLIGIPASSQGNLVTLQFQDGTWHTLSISAYCAGLYSFSIFLSAFISFVLVFERLPAKVLTIVLVAGIVSAYLGNLLRMVVVGIVGHFYGIDALHWTHENAGWVIFLCWSSLFWWLILGYASKHAQKDSTEVN